MKTIIEENILILETLFAHIKKERGITQTLFCAEVGEEESKVSNHKQRSILTSPKYTNLEEIIDFQLKIIGLIQDKYKLDFHKKIEKDNKSNKEVLKIHITGLENPKDDIFTFCYFSRKQEVEQRGYFQLNKESKQAILGLYFRDNKEFVSHKGKFSIRNNTLSIFIDGDEQFLDAHYCCYLGNKRISQSTILKGTFSCVNTENVPICGELVLLRTDSIEQAKQEIRENKVSEELQFYLKNKRIEPESKFITELQQLPTHNDRMELTRVSGDYTAYRLGDNGEGINTTPVRIYPDGRVELKNSVKPVLYHANAHIFLDTLLAVSTFSNGTEPFFVQSLFNIGRQTREELQILYGVCAGVTKSPVIPRAAREIWLRDDNCFELTNPQKIQIPSANSSLADITAYYSLVREHPEVISYLTGQNATIILAEKEV